MFFIFQISHIVIDEAHTVATWGTADDNGEPAFREAFANIRTIRSLVPHAKVLALTATATDTVREIITSSLLMGTVFPLSNVLTCPDREGVVLMVKNRPPSTGSQDVLDSYLFVLKPLFEELQEAGPDFPKTIVY